MADKKIYLIPGLGADGRMYMPQLRVLPNAVILEHQKPLKGETLVQYAKRLTAQVDTSEPFILIGTSLGGIIAIEMARIIHPDKVILISSVKHRGEMPIWMRAMRHLKLHKLLTGKNFVRFSNANVQRLTTKRVSSVGRLLMDMHNTADPEFVVWAINEVVNWKGGKDYHKAIVHIHGTRDLLFPHVNIKDAVYIKGGSHVMGLTQSQDVNNAILKAIED
jgi:pimeloyl-ACP methyl ester carboxylesterase